MLVENTSSNIQNNPAFDIVRSTKVSMMRDAKARFGKGNKEHLSCGLRVAEINYILGSDVLSLYTLFGLQALFYFQFCLYNLCRVGGQGSTQPDEWRDSPHLLPQRHPQDHRLHPLSRSKEKLGGQLQLQREG